MSPFERIELYTEEFTNSDHKIYKYLQKSLSDVFSYSITEIADKAGVSKSALLRFCKKIGYEGFTEFKYDVSRYLLSGAGGEETTSSSLPKILDLYSRQISSLSEAITPTTLHNLTNIILNSQRIRIFGIHESGLSATYMSYRLSSLGIDSEPICDSVSFNPKVSCAKKHDLNIFFSVSGANQQTSTACQTAFTTEAGNILITSNDHAKGAKNFDAVLVLPSISTNQSQLFLDTHSIVIIGIDIIINELAKIMNEK